VRRKGRIKGKDQGWRRGEGSGVRLGKNEKLENVE
jgi:hypothetical protein